MVLYCIVVEYFTVFWIVVLCGEIWHSVLMYTVVECDLL